MQWPAALNLRAVIRPAIPAILSLFVVLLTPGCGDRDPGPAVTGPVTGPLAGAVTGTVTSSASGGPVAGAEVNIGTATTTTGADGRFTLTDLPTGAATLRCTATGFVRFRADIRVTYGSVTRNIGLVPNPVGGGARLRVVHAEPEAPNLDVLVDDSKVLANVPYLTVSDYLEVQVGRRYVDVRLAGTTASLDGFFMYFADGAYYTLVPCCTGFPIPVVLTDDTSEPATGNAKIRALNFTSITTAHVYVTAPGADLTAATPTFALNSLDASDYIEVPAGDYRVRVTPWNTKTVVIDGGTLTLGAGQVRTAIAMDAAGAGEQFRFLVLED